MHADSHAVMATVCPNCETPGALSFCPRCGQKRPDSHDYALGHFFHDLFHEIAHVDGKIARTVRVMMAAPGQITMDHWEGRRSRYLTPLRIYLLTTAAFFALVKITGGMDLAAASGQFPDLSRMMAEFAPGAFEARFQVIYKGLLAGSVAGLALVFRWLLGGRPYGAYLIAALHSLSVLFTLTLLAQKLEEGLRAVAPLPPGTLGLVALVLLYWPYVAFSMRRWSGRGWGWVTGRVALMAVGSMVIDGLVAVLAYGFTLASLARASH